MTEYKSSKGTVFTLGLARAIPRLSGDSKTKARDALAQRLTRMTADTLRTMLKDTDAEIRRAASLACAMKDEKTTMVAQATRKMTLRAEAAGVWRSMDWSCPEP